MMEFTQKHLLPEYYYLAYTHIDQMSQITNWRLHAWVAVPVNGGMSVSVTISPSSMVVSEVIWSLCGNTGSVWHGVMPSVDVRVLLGISSACSMSSCFMISSASIAWPGESEPGVAWETQQRQVGTVWSLDSCFRCWMLNDWRLFQTNIWAIF